MSDMGYGQFDEGNPFEADQQQSQPPKWYREAMDKTGKTIAELRDEVAALKAENTRHKVGDVLESKGYSRSAAALYTGEPEKLDDWLAAHGGSLARTGGAQTETAPQETAPAGPPASTIPPEGQQAMQAMNGAGVGGQVAAGTDAELAAALAAAANPADFQRIAQANGWGYTLGGTY